LWLKCYSSRAYVSDCWGLGTLKDSSYFPTTESGLVIKKKYLKVYLEECLAEYLALGGIQRAPLIEAGQKLPDPFYWDLWGNLDHLRESSFESS